MKATLTLFKCVHILLVICSVVLLIWLKKQLVNDRVTSIIELVSPLNTNYKLKYLTCLRKPNTIRYPDCMLIVPAFGP